MTNSRFLLLVMLATAVIACFLQIAIEFSTENVAAASIVLASSLVALLYLMWTDGIQTHPLSTFSIFGFCFTTQLGALIIQTAQWTPIALNLRQPISTFATLAAFQFISIAAHALYRTFDVAADQKVIPVSHGPRALLQTLGVYEIPTPATLWIMGLIGVVAHLLSGDGGNAGVFGKVMQGIAFIAWMPFLLPMFVLNLGSSYCKARGHYIALFLYVGFIALLGIAANARGMMLSGMMTIALYALLTTLRSNKPVQAKRIAQVLMVGLTLGALTIPLSDLATAMVLARSVRKTAGPVKMVEETFYYLQQPALIKAQRESDHAASHYASYDESYFASPLMARLVETKFHDNALYFADRLTEKDKDRLFDITGDLLWSTLPDPMLKALSIDLDKKELRFSMGDYLSHLAGAGDLGGYKTGSGFAQGLALASYAFFFIYFLICPILFFAHDLFMYRSKHNEVWIAPLGMIGIWKLFQYGNTSESLQAMFMSLVRGLPQDILLYLLVFYFARWLARSFSALTGQNAPTALRRTTTPASEQPA